MNFQRGDHLRHRLRSVAAIACASVMAWLPMSSMALAAAPFYPMYYTAALNGGATVYRSHMPFTKFHGMNQTNTTTSVTMSAGSSADLSGFVVYAGTVGSLENAKIHVSSFSGSGGGVLLALWFDTNTANDTSANGPFFTWNTATPNERTGVGGDLALTEQAIALTGTGVLQFDSNTVFAGYPRGNFVEGTLNEMRGGGLKANGITSATPVAIQVYTFDRAGSATATVTSMAINGTQIPLNNLPEVPYTRRPSPSSWEQLFSSASAGSASARPDLVCCHTRLWRRPGAGFVRLPA